jgi:hypothetical protein
MFIKSCVVSFALLILFCFFEQITQVLESTLEHHFVVFFQALDLEDAVVNVLKIVDVVINPNFQFSANETVQDYFFALVHLVDFLLIDFSVLKKPFDQIVHPSYFLPVCSGYRDSRSEEGE